MGRKQKEKTYIKSIRVNEDIKDFLESLENANLFVLQLLEDTNEFKKCDYKELKRFYIRSW